MLGLLAENLRTHRAVLGGTQPMQEGEGEGDAGARAVVTEVLESTGYAEQRAAKMDGDDFLLLLSKFNEAGLHFSNME